MFFTALTMTEVETRVPNQTTYPPLPDIILDNVEKIPQAFDLTEFLILGMMFCFFILLIIHKHRWVILRRFFVISGSVFGLRCVTMYVTSLSVPDIHMECDIHGDLELNDKLIRAFQIISGGALSINGVRTCGDYMFSGHSSVLTILNYFLTEYTPLSWRGFAVVTWICNLVGMLCILIAHEHYSIDVLIAFFVSSRLFTFYHSLCNSSHLTGATHERARSFWPLFSYWEEFTDDVVPNEDILGLF